MVQDWGDDGRNEVERLKTDVKLLRVTSKREREKEKH
jgi:hypothetical protein